MDIDAQDEALARIRSLVHGTRTPGVLADIGSFGGLFAPDLSGLAEPVLVASCDGVGTKLRLAFESGIHDTVGRDLVNHCVNDILVQGARPLFFLDYVATARLDPVVLAAVVEGIARGCREAGCALLGGETAEMPGFYVAGEYDVAGFIVGIVDRARVVDGRAIRPGDVLVGLPSAGLHTNGYSLSRRIVAGAGLGLGDRIEDLGTVAELLLAEHRSYLPVLREPLDRGWIAGLAHVTGGGIADNLRRVLPADCDAVLERGAWPVPPLFDWLARTGPVEPSEMERTFNMGIGMIAVPHRAQLGSLEAHLEDIRERHFRIGRIEPGSGTVRYGS